MCETRWLAYSTPLPRVAGVRLGTSRMDIHSLWYMLAAILIVVGFIGTVLPALPGVPLVFAGMLVAAWADGFQHVGLWTLIGLGVLTVIAVAVDFLAGLAGAKRVGASRLALIGAAIGTIVGIFFGIPGLLLGPFLGALIGELVAGGTLQARDERRRRRVDRVPDRHGAEARRLLRDARAFSRSRSSCAERRDQFADGQMRDRGRRCARGRHRRTASRRPIRSCLRRCSAR